MKIIFFTICAFFFNCSLLLAQVENVKKLNEIQWVNNNTECYYNGNPYTGEVIDFSGLKFDKSKLLFDGHFKDGQKNGVIKKWYSNFKIEFIENYYNGLKDGIQTYFYNNGNKKAEYKYLNGQPDGAWTEWHDNKQLKTTCTYVMGSMIDGTYVTFLPDGQKESEVTYKSGKIITSGKYEGGKVVVIQELSSEKYPNGKIKSEGTLILGKKEGIWTTWYESGQKQSESIYKNGIQDGNMVTWFENGNKEQEGNYIFGEKDGKWISYYDNGQVDSTGNYSKGLKEGRWVSNYINHQNKCDGLFKDGMKDGKWITWFENGQKEYDGTYLNDLRSGYGIEYYNSSGKECYKGQWRMGTRNGSGEYFRQNSNGYYVTYSGGFYNDMYSGQGTIKNYSDNGTNLYMEFTGEWMDGKEYNGKEIIYRNVNGVNRAEEHQYVKGKESFWKGFMEDLNKDLQKH